MPDTPWQITLPNFDQDLSKNNSVTCWQDESRFTELPEDSQLACAQRPPNASREKRLTPNSLFTALPLVRYEPRLQHVFHPTKYVKPPWHLMPGTGNIPTMDEPRSYVKQAAAEP